MRVSLLVVFLLQCSTARARFYTMNASESSPVDIAEVLQAAHDGDSDAMTLLSTLYDPSLTSAMHKHGLLAPDEREALRWTRLASL